MLWIVALAAKVIGSLVLLLLVRWTYMFIKNRMRISFYEAQGVHIMANARKPVLGNMPDFIEFAETAAASPEAIPPLFHFMLNKHAKDKGHARFDGKDFPVVLQSALFEITLYVTDPAIT